MFVQFVFFIFTCDANQHIFFSQLVSYSRAKTQTRIAKEHFTARRVVLQLVAVACCGCGKSMRVLRVIRYVVVFRHSVMRLIIGLVMMPVEMSVIGLFMGSVS